jgi:hypothetical protein
MSSSSLGGLSRRELHLRAGFLFWLVLPDPSCAAHKNDSNAIFRVLGCCGWPTALFRTYNDIATKYNHWNICVYPGRSSSQIADCDITAPIAAVSRPDG